MTLLFESKLHKWRGPIEGDRTSKGEKRRREDLMDPDDKDVATGSFVGAGEAGLIGAQTATIAEKLIRSEGYDVSSIIVNGTSRSVLSSWKFGGDGDSDAGRSLEVCKRHRVAT
jgi:hypothetical protein